MKNKKQRPRRARSMQGADRARLVREPEIIRRHRPAATGALVGDTEAFEPHEVDGRPKA
jgi:hypothetical protein